MHERQPVNRQRAGRSRPGPAHDLAWLRVNSLAGGPPGQVEPRVEPASHRFRGDPPGQKHEAVISRRQPQIAQAIEPANARHELVAEVDALTVPREAAVAAARKEDAHLLEQLTHRGSA